ncbi:VOC family protein [Ornithinibacillus xuwenensis]|uniref:VOC family protein n=1 Tax=Ornithinibacillus xuwenensis TaxID=3144668 RepID=A0ABU9XGQ7_9BACI
MTDRIQSLTVLKVSDIKKSRDFYQNILGCEVTEWWALRDDEVKLGLKLLQADHVKDINPNSTDQKIVCDVYAYTDDFAALDTLHTKLTDNGATVVIKPEITKFKWGSWKEFAIADPDGYVIGFGTANK